MTPRIFAPRPSTSCLAADALQIVPAVVEQVDEPSVNDAAAKLRRRSTCLANALLHAPGQRAATAQRDRFDIHPTQIFRISGGGVDSKLADGDARLAWLAARQARQSSTASSGGSSVDEDEEFGMKTARLFPSMRLLVAALLCCCYITISISTSNLAVASICMIKCNLSGFGDLEWRSDQVGEARDCLRSIVRLGKPRSLRSKYRLAHDARHRLLFGSHKRKIVGRRFARARHCWQHFAAGARARFVLVGGGRANFDRRRRRVHRARRLLAHYALVSAARTRHGARHHHMWPTDR